MIYLWYLLIAASAVGCLAVVFLMKDAARYSGAELLPVIAVAAAGLLLLANTVYLLEHPANPSGRGRLRRMFSLWFQAKERELERRAKPD
jgi:hypothetical protein